MLDVDEEHSRVSSVDVSDVIEIHKVYFEINHLVYVNVIRILQQLVIPKIWCSQAENVKQSLSDNCFSSIKCISHEINIR